MNLGSIKMLFWGVFGMMEQQNPKILLLLEKVPGEYLLELEANTIGSQTLSEYGKETSYLRTTIQKRMEKFSKTS
jgi:hypothetical protein